MVEGEGGPRGGGAVASQLLLQASELIKMASTSFPSSRTSQESTLQNILNKNIQEREFWEM